MPIVYSQPVDLNNQNYPPPKPPAGIQLRTAATEICNNKIDDDNNGLTDEQDFFCYINNANPASCGPNAVIWACDGYGSLFWANIKTGAQKHVGKMPMALVDITWASNGKLYGCGGFPNGIYEIDPYTAHAQLIKGLDNYIVSNSMTADAAGNIYVVAYSLTTGMSIYKINLTTWDMCFIADISASGLGPAGDLTFMNDKLYLTCGNNTLAKIDVHTGAITTQKFINSTTPNYFGITNIGDGNLYVCDKGRIFQVDPVTLKVSNSPTITIGSSSTYLFGLASYTELCKAPTCTVKTHIEPNDKPPYCANLGIELKAGLTTCNNLVTDISWTTPAGNTVSGHKVKALEAGKYYLNYKTTTGACDRMDSFHLQYATNAPLQVVGSYRAPIGCNCTGTMTVIPGCGSGNFRYEWSNGGTTATVSNACPGAYTVKVTDIDWHKDTTIHFNIPASANTIQHAGIVAAGDHCMQHDGSITIDNVQGGTAPYQYALNNQPFGNAAGFRSLATGNYTITIRDNEGCILQKQVTIQAVQGPEKILYTKQDAYCGLPAGTLIIDSVRKGSPPFTFSINNSSFNPQTTFTNIPPGKNTLLIKDKYGCLLNESLTINQSEALRIAISPKDTTICATQKMTFKATLLSNNIGVQYLWNQAPSTTNTFPAAIITNTKMTVQAIDKNGCTAIDTAFVNAVYCDTLFARCVLFPSAFSPNRDGLNDTFGAHIGHCEIKKYKMTIYNRWGQMIFHTTNFYQRWNGETNGHIQQEGTYVFNCVWEDALGVAHHVKGSLVLIK
jgi:gliding motility-associated-like protein